MFETLERPRTVRERLSTIAVPAIVVAAVGAAVAGVATGTVRDGEAAVVGFVILAWLGGVFVALLGGARRLEAPERQTLRQHPGWFRFGAVGGTGGGIALLAFLVIGMLRAPAFVPVVGACIVLGFIVAFLLHWAWWRRSRRGASIGTKA